MRASVEESEATELSAISFPDPFAHAYVPNPYPYRDVIHGTKTARSGSLPGTSIPNPSSTVSYVQTNEAAAAAEVVGSTSEEERERRLRGLRESLRLTLRHQGVQRIALQQAAGQAVIDKGHKLPCSASLHSAGTAATPERARQNALRTHLLSDWAVQNKEAAAQRVHFRQERLQALRSRKLETLELETYCGSLRRRGQMCQCRACADDEDEESASMKAFVESAVIPSSVREADSYGDSMSSTP